MLTIYLVRHGKTLFNTLRRVQGWCDSPLTEEGREGARALGRGFKNKGIRFDAAYTSELGRHRETMREILDSMGQKDLQIHENNGFREVGFGSWEGELESVRDKVYCEKAGTNTILEIFNLGHLIYEITIETDTMGIAERPETVLKRMLGAIHSITEEQESGNVLVVSSGASITTLLDYYGSGIRSLDNCCVSLLYCEDDGVKIGSVGDMSYVESGRQ